LAVRSDEVSGSPALAFVGRSCHVVTGTLLLGYGEAFDSRAFEVFQQGCELLVPAGARHFDGSDHKTVIVGRATGVWSTHYVDPRHQGSAGTVR
jgi:hypothetical protein